MTLKLGRPWRRTMWCVAASCLAWLGGPPGARAAEGGLSLYIPGAVTDFGAAIVPGPGLYLRNDVIFMSQSTGAAVLQGRVNLGLDARTWMDFLRGYYFTDYRILGARYGFGIILPFIINTRLTSTLTGPLGNQVSQSGDNGGFSDMVIAPLVLNWSAGNFHFNLSQSIFAPTGSYDVSRVINLGRNYWAFDTAFSFTWLDPQRGHEISATAGFLINTTNTATNYRTGNEFHLDYLFAQYLSPSFAIAFNGYWYRQLNGDSGSGATLGPFLGESVGIGPAFLWMPRIRNARINIIGKWLHDVESTNRFHGDIAMVSLAFKF